jgi:hypothetical protein
MRWKKRAGLTRLKPGAVIFQIFNCFFPLAERFQVEIVLVWQNSTLPWRNAGRSTKKKTSTISTWKRSASGKKQDYPWLLAKRIAQSLDVHRSRTAGRAYPPQAGRGKLNATLAQRRAQYKEKNQHYLDLKALCQREETIKVYAFGVLAQTLAQQLMLFMQGEQPLAQRSRLGLLYPGATPGAVQRKKPALSRPESALPAGRNN